jgi:D-ribose pyranase
MKKRGLLHPELARVVASLGHGDTLVVADAGLPVPSGVARIDLAYRAGQPPFLDVLAAVLEEMQLERATLAEEVREVPPPAFRGALLAQLTVPVDYLPHQAFKRATAQARVVVRSGEFTPYANVILHSGVLF